MSRLHKIYSVSLAISCTGFLLPSLKILGQRSVLSIWNVTELPLGTKVSPSGDWLATIEFVEGSTGFGLSPFLSIALRDKGTH